MTWYCHPTGYIGYPQACFALETIHGSFVPAGPDDTAHQ
jgi:hypothetical protein